MSAMPAPKPRDPRAPRVSAEDLTRAVEAILAEPVEDLAAEADQLSRAHAVLHDALQDR